MSTFGINDPGPLVIATDIDEAVIAVLQQWLPTYLRLLSEERALKDDNGSAYVLPAPKAYDNYLDTDELMDHPTPSIVVTTAKVMKTVGAANTANVQAVWLVRVSAIVRGRSPRESKRNAALFEGAVRRCMLNKARQSAGPLNDTQWIDCEVAPVAGGTRGGRYLAAGMGTYHVSTDAAVRSFGGPDIPDADGYTPSATVINDGVEITVAEKTE